jgi:hypothetical protein
MENDARNFRPSPRRLQAFGTGKPSHSGFLFYLVGLGEDGNVVEIIPTRNNTSLLLGCTSTLYFWSRLLCCQIPDFVDKLLQNLLRDGKPCAELPAITKATTQAGIVVLWEDDRFEDGLVDGMKE